MPGHACRGILNSACVTPNEQHAKSLQERLREPPQPPQQNTPAAAPPQALQNLPALQDASAVAPEAPKTNTASLTRLMSMMGPKGRTRFKCDSEEEEEDEENAPKTKKQKGAPAKPKNGGKNKKAGAKRAGAQPAGAKPAGAKPRFPGVPKANKVHDPVEYGCWRIYTDLKSQNWRCKQQGERSDISCSFKVDPEAAWKKVLRTIS